MKKKQTQQAYGRAQTLQLTVNHDLLIQHLSWNLAFALPWDALKSNDCSRDMHEARRDTKCYETDEDKANSTFQDYSYCSNPQGQEPITSHWWMHHFLQEYESWAEPGSSLLGGPGWIVSHSSPRKLKDNALVPMRHLPVQGCVRNGTQELQVTTHGNGFGLRDLVKARLQNVTFRMQVSKLVGVLDNIVSWVCGKKYSVVHRNDQKIPK